MIDHRQVPIYHRHSHYVAKRGIARMKTDKRRAAFIQAANELYVQKGISKTSIHDITEKVGVTRSLFYHYFGNKQAITDAVIDHCVNEYFAYAVEWSKCLKNTGPRNALVAFSRITREYLLGPTSLYSHIVLEQNSALSHRFAIRSAQVLSEKFVSTKGSPGALIELTSTKHPLESCYTLVVGVATLLIQRPEVSDAVIADLIADMLCMNLDASPAKHTS